MSKSKETKISSKRYALSELGIKPSVFSPNAVKVCQDLVSAGYQAYIVGGAVRDSLLGMHPKDFDVATNATPEQIKRVFRRSRIIGRRFRIVHVYMRDELIEVTTFRAPANNRQTKLQHADASGRLLRDNVYGKLEDDVWRRDFTVNALYYDTSSHEVIDYCEGMLDIKAKVIRLMGDPLTRYQEDPVRLLRAVRFKSKLGFGFDKDTEKPITTHPHLLATVPAARLFDEVLKMFIKGYGAPVFKDVLHYGLLEYLFPKTDAVIKADKGPAKNLITQAMLNTDKRITIGKTVSPVFFFAVMLWPGIENLANVYIKSGDAPVNAWTHAALSLFAEQQSTISIPRRIGVPAQNVLIMQSRFENPKGRRVFWLLEQQRFRAAYDLMLLRSEFGLVSDGTADWWTKLQTLEHAEKEILIFGNRRSKSNSSKKTSKHRKKTRKKTKKKKLTETSKKPKRTRRKRKTKNKIEK